jgi:hypothetical protein
MASVSRSIGAIATGAFVGLWVIVVLTVFDPHLTMRGVGDLMFPMLAMVQIGVIASRARENSPLSKSVEVLS